MQTYTETIVDYLESGGKEMKMKPIQTRLFLDTVPKCPFCGAMAELRARPAGFSKLRYSVACSATADECPIIPETGHDFTDPKEAMQAWSKRSVNTPKEEKK